MMVIANAQDRTIGQFINLVDGTGWGRRREKRLVMYPITNLNGKRSTPLTIDKFTTRSRDILAKDTFNADPTSIPGFDTSEQEHTSGLYGTGTRLDRRNAFTNIQPARVRSGLTEIHSLSIVTD
jgi:hypothetical protein